MFLDQLVNLIFVHMTKPTMPKVGLTDISNLEHLLAVYVTLTDCDIMYIPYFNYPCIIIVPFIMISQKLSFIKKLKPTLAKKLTEMTFIKKEG